MWFQQINEHVAPGTARLLVGNKLDRHERITNEEGAAKAADYGAMFIETSAKTGDNVASCFSNLSGVLIERNPEVVKAIKNERLLMPVMPKKEKCC